MTDAERKALVREILDVPIDEHLDRVARINARFVLASGEEFYGTDGYRNPKLLDGVNTVKAYLVMLALDYGVDLTKEGLS